MPPRARTAGSRSGSARARSTMWQTHKSTPWSGVVRDVKRMRKRAGAKWNKAMGKHPMVALTLSIVFAIVGTAALVLGVLTENLLYGLVVALGALGSVAVRRAQRMEEQRQQQKRAHRPTVVTPQPAADQPPAGEPQPDAPAKPRRPTSRVIKCTRTGKVAKDCDCAPDHVTSQDGVDYFGRPFGHPLGPRNRKATSKSTPKRPR